MKKNGSCACASVYVCTYTLAILLHNAVLSIVAIPLSDFNYAHNTACKYII